MEEGTGGCLESSHWAVMYVMTLQRSKIGMCARDKDTADPLVSVLGREI